MCTVCTVCTVCGNVYSGRGCRGCSVAFSVWARSSSVSQLYCLGFRERACSWVFTVLAYGVRVVCGRPSPHVCCCLVSLAPPAISSGVAASPLQKNIRVRLILPGLPTNGTRVIAGSGGVRRGWSTGRLLLTACDVRPTTSELCAPEARVQSNVAHKRRRNAYSVAPWEVDTRG